MLETSTQKSVDLLKTMVITDFSKNRLIAGQARFKTGQKKKQPYTVVHDCYVKTIFRI